MTCRNCGEEFVPRPNKPGYVDQCENCATDVPKLGGNMIWSHKTAPDLEIKPLAQARQFAKLQARIGAGVTRSLIQSKITNEMDHEASKTGSGAEPHARYFSRLGESRNVKS